MKLYEISNDMKRLEDLNLEPEAIKDTMEGLEMSFNDKANNIAILNGNFSSDITAIDNEIKRLQAMKKTITNRQEQLKEYLRFNMSESGITSIKCDLFNITLRKASKVVQIDNEDDLPDEFVTVKTTISPDKNLIAKALKDGVSVSGASLVDGQQSLIIK